METVSEPFQKWTLVHTPRRQDVVTDALLKNEANTKEIERVKIGSKKICVREDQAKDRMVFSEQSSRAIFEMGNVELI